MPRANFKKVLFQVMATAPSERLSPTLGHELDEAMRENHVPKGLDIIGLIRYAMRKDR